MTCITLNKKKKKKPIYKLNIVSLIQRGQELESNVQQESRKVRIRPSEKKTQIKLTGEIVNLYFEGCLTAGDKSNLHGKPTS